MSHERTARRTGAALTLAATVALLSAGCGGGDEPAPPPPEQAETAPPSETEPGGAALEEVRVALQGEGYEVSDGPPAEGGEAERLGATEGLLVSNDELLAEVFAFPSPGAAEEYTDTLIADEPTVVSENLVFAGAPDDSQADIDELAEAGGVEP